MDPILAIARKHKLSVIEDACQAHGAMYKGRKVGTLGDIGCFSLNNFKNLCGGEGGLFVTDNEAFLEKGVLIRCFGDEVDEVSKRRVYNASILGYMYRNQELPAALTRAQLLHLDEYNRARIANAQYLTPGAGEDPGRDPALLPAGLHPRVLHVQRAFRPAGRRGCSCEPRRFRIAVEKALYAEGHAGRPVADHARSRPGPVPEQAGLRRHGLPLDDQRGQGHPLQLRPGAVPGGAEAVRHATPSCTGSTRPNGRKLMDKIRPRFRKVFADLDVAVAHADDPIYPGADGALYGAG